MRKSLCFIFCLVICFAVGACSKERSEQSFIDKHNDSISSQETVETQYEDEYGNLPEKGSIIRM